MTPTLLLVCLSLAADDSALADQLVEQLSWAADLHLGQDRAATKTAVGAGATIVFDLVIDDRGRFGAPKLSRSSGNDAADALARQIVIAAADASTQDASGYDPAVEDEAPPPPPTPCLLRLQLEPNASAALTGICMPLAEPSLASGCDKLQRDGRSADVELFRGWCFDANGDPSKSLAAFRRALAAEPQWDTAVLAMGLALARSGRLDDARPYLERYAARNVVTSEIGAYLDGRTPTPLLARASTELAKGSVVTDALAEVSRCERDQAQIQAYVAAHFDALSKCVDTEHERNPGGVLPPSLTIGFVVEPSGRIRNVRIDHRSFRSGPLPECFVGALTDSLASHKGADCPASFALELTTIQYTKER